MCVLQSDAVRMLVLLPGSRVHCARNLEHLFEQQKFWQSCQLGHLVRPLVISVTLGRGVVVVAR